MEKQVKKITLRLPDELYEALKKINETTGLAVSDLLIISILNNVPEPSLRWT